MCIVIIFICIYTVTTVVDELSDDLRTTYGRNRQRSDIEEWPPNQPSSSVNLALIHYQDRRTQEELSKISKRCKEGASQVDEMVKLDCNVTKDIQKIFVSKGGNESSQFILIEGAPGIGKTVLAKEIVYQWANGKILKEYTLVFLLYLRDPKLHKVKSFNEILKLFTSESENNIFRLTNLIEKSHGKSVAFVFDGFDEYPVKLQRESFITSFITGKNNEKVFLKSMVIVTSRPTATLFLHEVVDRRIEILGFPKEERDQYVSMSLKNSLLKKQEFDEYLKQHPVIDNLCYIPLHLAILMYLYQQDSLPKTLTEMNESLIINIIYRYLKEHKVCPSGIVKKLKDLPTGYCKIVKQLAQLAFNGQCKQKIVFTRDEVIKVCPIIESKPGNINGFGLLQAVQHYPKRGSGRTISVNFLHFTLQEYLSAFHVSTLPSHRQLQLMRETFWDGKFNFMWMMYVGIVGVKSYAFKSFIGDFDYPLDDRDRHKSYTLCDYVYDDKIKCLHLFQCYMEAKSDTKMPKAILHIFNDGNIILNGITLLPYHISSLINFMSASVTQQWKTLQLANCNLGDIEMSCLLEHASKSDSMSTLEYVDLSRNRSSAWGVYCAIIRHCCVSSLTLFGDEGMQEHVNDIIDSLQINTSLESLTLYSTDYDIKAKSKKRPMAIDGKLLKLNSSSEMINIKILYNYNDACLSENTISLSNKDLNDDTMCLITLGLYDNTTIKVLDISHNSITDVGAVVISKCLKHNNTIQKLELSRNKITINGAMCINFLEHNDTLQELDISHNNIADKGVKVLSDSLRCNSGLQELNISHNDITFNGAMSIGNFLKDNKALQKLDISHNKIADNGLEVITDSLRCNNGLQELKISHNDITINGAEFIGSFLKHNTTLQKLDISHNKIGDNGLAVISKSLRCNSGLLEFNISHNDITINGAELIGDLLKQNKTLQQLNISHNNIADNGGALIFDGLKSNNTLQKLDISHSNITDDGAMVISDSLRHNNAIKELNLSQNAINIKGMDMFSECVKYIQSLEYIDLSQNRSSPWKVYCAIIRKCDSNNLKFCGNEGIKAHAKEIKDSLQMNTKLQSLILHGYIDGYKSNKAVQSILDIKGILYFNTSSSDDGNRTHNNIARGVGIEVKIFCCSNHDCSSESISTLPNGIKVNLLTDEQKGTSGSVSDEVLDYVTDVLYLLSLGLNNNMTIRKLDLSHNKMSNDGAVIISDCLKRKNTIKELNLSHNRIGVEGMDKLSQYALSLEYIDLSANKSSPWKAYYVIIRGCHSSNLTLCGDEGIKAHAEEITNGLQNNITLQSLTLHGYMGYSCTHSIKNVNSILDIDGKLFYNNAISDDRNRKSNSKLKRVVDVKVKIFCYGNQDCSPNHVSMSDKSINDDSVYLITFGLYHNTKVKKLDLSNNKITSDGVSAISNCLKHNSFLMILKLSENSINHKGAEYISEAMHISKIQELDLSCTEISNDGVMAISNCLKTNRTLQVLNLSQSCITCKGAKALAETIKVNSNLRKLDISSNDIHDDGVMYISDSLRKNCTLLELGLSKIGISDKGAESIIKAMRMNRVLRKLDLSENHNISKRVVNVIKSTGIHLKKLNLDIGHGKKLLGNHNYK